MSGSITQGQSSSSGTGSLFFSYGSAERYFFVAPRKKKRSFFFIIFFLPCQTVLCDPLNCTVPFHGTGRNLFLILFETVPTVLCDPSLTHHHHHFIMPCCWGLQALSVIFSFIYSSSITTVFHNMIMFHNMIITLDWKK